MVHDASSAGLDSIADPINGAALARFLRDAGSEVRVQVLDHCPSTNALLLERARAGAPHASAIVCEHQSAGRGRQGHAWISEPGDSLTFSLLWRFDAHLSGLPALGLALAVASARALESQGAQGIRLKWPNDLLFEGRKLGGILIDSFRDAGGTSVVAGIGLNVANARSLQTRIGRGIADLRESGLRVLRTDILAVQLAYLEQALAGFALGGFAPVRDQWMARDAWPGRRLQLTSASGIKAEGESAGIAEDGALLLRCNGVVKAHYSGELSLRPA